MLKSEIFSTKYLRIFIFSIVFGGFITNFIPLKNGVNTGTLIADGIILYSILIFIVFTQEIKIVREGVLLIKIFFLFSCGVILICIISFSSIYEVVAGIRNHIFHIFTFYTSYLSCKYADRRKLILFLIKNMYIINIYAGFQFLFSPFLPEKFLVLQGANNFQIFGITSYRCTGLVGDMLVYGGFSIITFILLLSYLQIYDKSAKFYLLLIIPFVTNILTFNRTSIAGMIFIGLADYLFLTKEKFQKKLLIISIVITGLFVWVFKSYLGNKILMRFMDHAINKYSNSRHISTYGMALKILSKNFFFGVGMGTQLASGRNLRIVNDGYWWECALELGVPVFTLLVVFFLYSIYLSYNIQKSTGGLCKLLSGSYFFISVYFFAVSFINSSFEPKVNFCLMMILLGMMLSDYSEVKSKYNDL